MFLITDLLGLALLFNLFIFVNGKLESETALLGGLTHEYDGSDLFEENRIKVVNWNDESLQALLWGGRENIPREDSAFDQPRVLKRMTSGPAIKLPCIFCNNKRNDDDPNLSLSDFTVQKMIDQMLKPIEYEKPCVFYGQRPNGAFPPRFSDLATVWACSTTPRKRTIWNLWPRENSCAAQQNYYCLFNDCCWLRPIMGTGDAKSQHDNRLKYFASMSSAMASVCRGEVYIMTDDPDNVPVTQLPGKDPSIWINDELPVLRQSYSMGIVTKFWAVDLFGIRKVDQTGVLQTGSKKTRIETWGANITSILEWSLVTEKEHSTTNVSLQSDGEFEKRWDACSAAVSNEPAGQDFFG